LFTTELLLLHQLLLLLQGQLVVRVLLLLLLLLRPDGNVTHRLTVTWMRCTVHVFLQKSTLEDAIGSHACSLEVLTCV
jgi:hypothetical protein